ncbi:MAG: hypothetical protein ACRCZ0_01185 [Cetobacterium sp.]
MAKSKKIVDYMYKRFQKNGTNIPKNMNSNKADLIAKMKKGGNNEEVR